MSRRQKLGKVQPCLLGREDWLFNKQRVGTAFQLQKGFGVQAGGVCDKGDIIVFLPFAQRCELPVQQRLHAIAQRARKIAAQRVYRHTPGRKLF